MIDRKEASPDRRSGEPRPARGVLAVNRWLAAALASTAAVPLAVTASVPWSSSAAPAGVGQPPADFVAWVNDALTKNGIPGASIAVVDNYAIEWASGFG